MNIEKWIRTHKALAIVAGLGLLFLLYILLRGQSSGAAQTPQSQALAYTSQEQQLAAAQDTQSAQLQAQTNAQQLSAQVQDNQVNASLSAQNESTDASLVAALAQNQTQAQAYSLSAEVTNNQNSLEAGVDNNQINAEYDALVNTNQTDLSAYDTEYNDQAGLTSQALSESSALEGESLSDSYNINNSIVDTVEAAGLNHGTSSLENSLTAILGEVEGNTGIGEAAENANAVGSAAGASEFNNLVSQIGSFGKTAVSAAALGGL
jgi:hypothetical protein